MWQKFLSGKKFGTFNPLFYSVSFHYTNKEHEIRKYVFYLVIPLVGVGSMNSYGTVPTTQV